MPEIARLFVLGSFVVACSAAVPRFPRPGESLQAEAFTVEAGGKGLNFAVGASRLGAVVDGVLAVGNDLFGQFAASMLAQAGLPPSMLRRCTASTGAGIGFTDGGGENCLAVHLGANLYLTAADVREAEPALHRSRLVLAQMEIGDEPILEAFTMAREAGIPTLLNPSPFRPIDARILARTSILVLNEVEARHLDVSLGLGTASKEQLVARLAASLLGKGTDIVIVTLGARGAVAHRRGMKPLRQPAFDVQAIDTLGAGDAFTAALAVSLAEGHSLARGLDLAAACGAIVTLRRGVFDALPTQEALDQFTRRTPRRPPPTDEP